jgi:hypothetical protein
MFLWVEELFVDNNLLFIRISDSLNLQIENFRKF